MVNEEMVNGRDLIAYLLRWRRRHISDKNFVLLISFFVGIFTACAGLLLKWLIEQIEDFVDIDEELKILGLIKAEAKKKEKVKATKYRVYSYGGFEIFVGKNNVQNEKLTFSAERSDIWLHAKDFHSSHVIIKTHGEPVPDNVLLFAAEVCAYYSDAREADKVPIDYTLKKYVKKSNGKAIGLVYYTDQKTLFVKPDSHLK